ncbi:MAG: hypothetical protein OXF41_03965 [bacterium]|nr:hypothetical protein [bacterium]
MYGNGRESATASPRWYQEGHPARTDPETMIATTPVRVVVSDAGTRGSGF